MEYRPRNTYLWEELRPIVIPVVRDTQPVSWSVALQLLKTAIDFGRWCFEEEWTDRNAPAMFTGRNIDRYTQQREGQGRGPAARVDHGRLGRLVGTVHGERPRTQTLYRPVPRPYSRTELIDVHTSAKSLGTPRLRAATEAIVVLGAGAGLLLTEMRDARRCDIDPDGSFVRVGGDVPRAAPVLPGFRADIAELAATDETYVVMPHKPRPNRKLLANFLTDRRSYGAAPDANRLRSFYIVELLRRGLGPQAILQATGFQTFQGLDKYRHLLPKLTDDQILDHLDRTEPRQ